MISNNLKDYIFGKIYDDDRIKTLDKKFREYKRDYNTELHSIEKEISDKYDIVKDVRLYANIDRCNAYLVSISNMADKHMRDIVAEMELDKSKKSKEFVEKAVNDSVNAIIKDIKIAMKDMDKHVKRVKKGVKKFAV